jgi:CRP-like cAMP-binding protein
VIGSERSRRGRFGRSAFQFERKASGTGASPDGQLWQGTEPEPVIAKMSQETLAEIVGTTRSRISTAMNKFRELGFINYNGNLEVHNSLLDVILHDKP